MAEMFSMTDTLSVKADTDGPTLPAVNMLAHMSRL